MIQNTTRGSAKELRTMNHFENPSRVQSQEIELLKEELREAKETLDAIRTGAADALVVARNGKEVVYTYYRDKRHALWRNLASAFANRVADFVLDKPRGLYLSSFRCMTAFVAREIGFATGASQVELADKFRSSLR